MNILGVADGPDASAALVVDGALVAAVAQDRVERVRRSGAFPSAAIDAVLDTAGLRARDIDRVVLAGALSAAAVRRARPDLAGRTGGRLRQVWRGYKAALRASGLYMVEQDVAKKLLAPVLRDIGLGHAVIDHVEHDRAHATAAYRCQDRGDALVLVLDTAGDGGAVTVSAGRHLQLDRLFLQTSLAGISTFPERVARLLGVEVAEISARAAAATAPAALLAAFREEVAPAGDGFVTRPAVRSPDPLVARTAAYAPEEVAAAARDAIAEAVRAFVRRWVERTGNGHLALAGALFGDPFLCGQLLEEPSVESLSVFPAPGDEGLAVGAALHAAGSAMRRLPSLGLGPRYSDDDCYRALSVAALPRQKPADPTAAVVALLAAGRSVARFDGPLEVSPGGLASRVVLFRPDDPALTARTLAALRRPAWTMPGCAVRAEDAPDALRGVERAAAAARARALALPTTPAFDAAHPGVIAAGGTALPNLVVPDEEPGVAALLDAWHQRTGQRALGQLDLRFGDEPIACSPGDAVRAWRASDVDALLLGPYLVERSALAT